MSTPIAFQNLADPYAWVIRGLIELGWEDISLSPQTYPQRKGRGIDYSPLLNPLSQFGLRLTTLALDHQQQWYRHDGIYEYELRLVRDPKIGFGILLRSDEMAFSKLFPWNTSHPLHTVEDIHRCISESTARFVQNRKQGISISSIDLQEMLNHPLMPPPPSCTSFLNSRLYQGRDMNTALQEGLWHTQTAPQIQPSLQPTTHASPQTPNVSVQPAIEQPVIPPPVQINAGSGNPTPSWTIEAGQGRGQVLGSAGLASQGHSAAIVLLEKPANYLKLISYLGMFFGTLALVNSLFTLYMMSDGNVVRGTKDGLYLVVVICSAGLGIFGILGGWASMHFHEDFRTLSKRTTKLLPLAFAWSYPLTWWIGVPIAIWTQWVLRNPKVKPYWQG